MLNSKNYRALKNGDRLRKRMTGESVMVLGATSNFVTVSSTRNDRDVGETFTYPILCKLFWLEKRYSPKKPIKEIWTGPRMPRDEYIRAKQNFINAKRKIQKLVSA